MPKRECDNPFRIPGPKRKHGYDVKYVSTDRVAELRRSFPELRFKDNLKLCVSCRTESFAKLQKRNEVRNVVHAAVSEVASALHNVRVDRLPPPPESLTSEVAFSEPSAPTVVSEEEDSNFLEEERQAGPSNASNIYPELPSSAFDSQPTTPSTWTRTSVYPAVPTESSYNDVAIAKEKLNRSLKTIGESPLPAGIKSMPARLREKVSKTAKKWKTLFQEAVGKQIEGNDSECTCSHCKTMEAAIYAKLDAVGKTKKERYLILTCLPPSVTILKMQENLGISTYVARQVSQLRRHEGPFSVPHWKSSAHPIGDEVKKAVSLFYESDEHSRVSPISRETVLVSLDGKTKVRVPRRHMLTNLKDAFEEFKIRNPEMKIGISKFAQLRPKTCKWPGHRGFPVSCTCIIHENFKLILDGLRNALHDKLQENTEVDALVMYSVVCDLNELVEYVLCSDPSENCYLGYCEYCPMEVAINNLLEALDDDYVEFFTWQSRETTIIMKVNLKEEEFQEKFREMLFKYLPHEYLYRKQKDFVAYLRSDGLTSSSVAVVNVDFGENYSFVVQNAVQGFHWTNQQATIHPFVVYCRIEGSPCFKTYFVISDELKHDATSFHVFRSKVIRLIRAQLPEVTHFEYVSDGAGGQYKNYKNLCNLLYHKDEYGITANWHFTATSHGKSTCDGMSAVVKRFLRLKSINESLLILSSTDMYNVATQHLTSESLEFVHVSKAEVEIERDALDTRYNGMRKVPGIRKYHCFQIDPDGSVIAKLYSASRTFEKYTMFVADDAGVDAEPRLDTVINVGSFYAILIGKTYQIGRMLEEKPDTEECELIMMKKSGRGGVALTWPLATKNQIVPYTDVLCRVDAPVCTTATTSRISAADLKRVLEKLTSRLCTIRDG